MTIIVQKFVNGKLELDLKDVPHRKPKCFTQDEINRLSNFGLLKTNKLPLKGRDDQDE